MFGRIRRRLTLGYVGILAVILLLFGVIVVFVFSDQLSQRQDRLLVQKAETEVNSLINDSKYGSVKATTKSDIAVVAVPTDGPDDGRILDRDSTGSLLGLPATELAQKAAQKRTAFPKTVSGPEGDVRVMSVFIPNSEGRPLAVVQAAQSREVVWDTVRNLVIVLSLVGLGALALAFVGGLFMSRRAMRPVQDSFVRQRTFIADASHELKTPLTLIRADAEVLQREMTDLGQRELADDLLSETDRMNAVLSDLLLLTRLDAGKLSVSQETFDLSQAIIQTTERFRARAEAEGIGIETELSGKLPVRGDEDRTEQILAALLDNAIRFTQRRGSITVSGVREDGKIAATVTDTGPGIPPEHLPRIFDRFYRVEEARTRAPSGGGTGLGLSIARDLARAQGGKLTAGNAKDGGASFTLELPAGA